MSSMQSFDEALFRWINRDLANPAFDFFFTHITDLHRTPAFQVVVFSLLLVALYRAYGKKAFFILVGLILSLWLTDTLGGWGKEFWQRPRPFDNLGLEVIKRSGTGSFSFPSNHAGNLFCAALFLTTFFPRHWGLLFLYASLVSISRVYNGVHYPSDVLAGAVLGGVVGILVANLIKRAIIK